MTEPIQKFLPRWHAQFGSELSDGLADLIADDAVFFSPIVFKPQHGKELTVMYLTAAGKTFAGDGQLSDRFGYVKEVAQGSQAVLEFECEVDGVLINGVDIITVNDDGLVTEFKVMIRPMRAIELMRRKMMEMLESLKAS